MAMYMDVFRWEDAIAVAQSRVSGVVRRCTVRNDCILSVTQGHSDLTTIRTNYFQWLMDSGQEERAGEVREREGDLDAAISLYMKAGLPARAARVVQHHPQLSGQPDLLQQIASSLVKAGLQEKAGEMYELARNFQQAMEAYRSGGAYRRAVELARVTYPNEVVGLEEQWGDHLCSRKQYDAAIMHYIEAG